MSNDTEAQTAAGSLVEELQPLVKPMPGHFRIRWFEARDVIDRREAAWQAERDGFQARIADLEAERDRLREKAETKDRLLGYLVSATGEQTFGNAAVWIGRAKVRFVELEAERARLQVDLDKARSEAHALHRERSGEVWYWQGDADDHLESLTCPVLIEANDLREIVGERDALAAFKSFVHARLDAAGIPTHPDGPHSAAGCRVGDRLDLLVGERDHLRAWYYELEAECPNCENLAIAVNQRDEALRALGNLLACVFGDGGHRQAEIGDTEKAVEIAHEIVAGDRQALEDLRGGLSALVDKFRSQAATCDALIDGGAGPKREMQCIADVLVTCADRLTALLAASSAAGAGGAGEEEGGVGE